MKRRAANDNRRPDVGAFLPAFLRLAAAVAVMSTTAVLIAILSPSTDLRGRRRTVDEALAAPLGMLRARACSRLYDVGWCVRVWAEEAGARA